MNLGAKVKQLRKSLQLTQKQFAERIPGRVDHSYIGRIERGQGYPSIKFLMRLAGAYHVPMAYFFLDASLVKAVSLNVKEDVRHWLLENLPAFEEKLREKVEESIEKALRELQSSGV